MKLKRKCHLQALSDVVELSLWAGVIALVGTAIGLGTDIYWVHHDIKTNGISDSYIAIRSGLRYSFAVTVISGVICIVALVRHHNNKVKELILNKRKQHASNLADKAIKKHYMDRHNRKHNRNQIH